MPAPMRIRSRDLDRATNVCSDSRSARAGAISACVWITRRYWLRQELDRLQFGVAQLDVAAGHVQLGLPEPARWRRGSRAACRAGSRCVQLLNWLSARLPRALPGRAAAWAVEVVGRPAEPGAQPGDVVRREPAQVRPAQVLLQHEVELAELQILAGEHQFRAHGDGVVGRLVEVRLVRGEVRLVDRHDAGAVVACATPKSPRSWRSLSSTCPRAWYT